MAEKIERSTRILPNMTVGVMGSSGGVIPPEILRKVHILGREIGKRHYTLVTGACPGLPHEAAKGAKSAGGVVIGISPALNFQEHVEKYKSPVRGYDALVYTGSGLMGREIENIRTCDVVIFARGRSGTLGEFAIAYDESKVIGILQGTGGITDHLNTIVSIVRKGTGALLVASTDPTELLDRLEEIYQSKILPGYESLMKDHDPDGTWEDQPVEPEAVEYVRKSDR